MVYQTSLSALVFAAARRLVWFIIPGLTFLKKKRDLNRAHVGEWHWFRRSNLA
ncbi:hypothetical protein [Bradyrhizobium hipponense]|uniref:hypothetical protein n=1 Tax=Bradyrhizobium hipponense TaxID=2605638 RepID=UPI0016531874|nr:hypothetical protein [Bradyrhizobium hipponense]